MEVHWSLAFRNRNAIKMAARLLHYRDGNFQAVLDLQTGSFEIGRSKKCDFVLDNPTVSRHHFRLKIGDDEKVTDEQTQRGLFCIRIAARNRPSHRDWAAGSPTHNRLPGAVTSD